MYKALQSAPSVVAKHLLTEIQIGRNGCQIFKPRNHQKVNSRSLFCSVLCAQELSVINPRMILYPEKLGSVQKKGSREVAAPAGACAPGGSTNLLQIKPPGLSDQQ